MRPLRFFLFGIISIAAFAAERTVRLAPFKAKLSDIYFLLSYDPVSRRVTEVKVTGVLPGSAAEKLGISEGDRLNSINGLPVVGRIPSDIWDSDNETIILSGPVTFIGRRGTGFFRQPWTLTVDGALLKNKKEPNPPLPPTAGVASEVTPAGKPDFIAYNSDGSVKTRGVYQTDAKGRVMKYSLFDGAAKLRYVEVPYYADDGRIIRADHRDADGKLVKVVVYFEDFAKVMDGEGKVIDTQGFSQQEFLKQRPKLWSEK